MDNLKFLELQGERTELKPFNECGGIEYTINLMIKHPDWIYLQQTYTQESIGLEEYFDKFPGGKFTEDRVNEIWKERRLHNYYNKSQTYSKEDL